MSEKDIVIYSSPGCSPCKAAKRFLDNLEREYDERDIEEKLESEDNNGAVMIKLPKICIDGECVDGFDREEIMEKLEKS